MKFALGQFLLLVLIFSFNCLDLRRSLNFLFNQLHAEPFGSVSDSRAIPSLLSMRCTVSSILVRITQVSPTPRVFALANVGLLTDGAYLAIKILRLFGYNLSSF